MKFFLLLFAIALCWLQGFSQEIKGTVKDSVGNAVSYASINLRTNTNSTIVAYTITDARGGYTLKLPAGKLDSLYLEVRCIGYKTQSRRLAGLPPAVDFTLVASVNQLQSVVVKSSRPVLRKSGDTLSYKVSQFSTAQDRVIGDVIKRLPGITVTADGTIYYNGRPVSGVYIAGDNLLDDKYNIATNTIPNGVVDDVQVIDNHQPIKVLKNKVASNDVALNLTFKDKAKLHVVGQETIGAGLPGNYDEDFNAMLFNTRYKAINYVKGNNTGDDLQRELASHNNMVYMERTGNYPPATVLSLGAVNNPDLAQKRYFFNRSGLLNINNLVNLNNGLQLRVNAYYLHDKQRQDYSQNTSIFLPGDTVKYTETQHNQFNPSLFHAQFTVNANKEKYYLNNAFIVDDSRWANYSALNTNGALLNQVLTRKPLSFSNEFSLIRTVKSTNIIEVYAYISHIAEPATRTIGVNYNDSLFNNDKPYNQLVQQVNVPTWFANNYLSYKIPGRLITQSFKTGFSVQSQTLTSSLGVQQADNTVHLKDDSAVNNLAWNNKKLYAEADFDMPEGKLKGYLALPVTLLQLAYADAYYALNKHLNRVYFNPTLNLKYQTGAEHFVALQYSYRNQAGTIQDVYQGCILKDYRTLYANNAELTLRQNQQVSAGFSYHKALSLFFFSVYATYNNSSANNIDSSVITKTLQQRVVLPYRNSTGSWSVDGSISKYSFALHTTFSASAQWQTSRWVQIQNGALLPFNTTVKKITLGVETKLTHLLNYSYNVTGTQTGSRSATAGAINHINQLMQQASVYYYPATNLQFKLSGEHCLTGGRANAYVQYFFADASVKYTIKKWRTDVQLDANNVFNVKTYKAVYLSANTLSASSYTLPGRIIMLKVLFNL